MRVMHESQCHPDSSFITLTYGTGKLPPLASLDHRDFQLFMKRLRKSRPGQRIRFFMCGEYGPLNGRPHYHAVIFGEGFRADRVPAGKSNSGKPFFTSKELETLWSHGNVSVQDLTPETASYCARYIMKKVLGQAAADHYGERRPEYAAMSKKPGIGAKWFERFGVTDCLNLDQVVHDGKERQVPRYYDKLARRSGHDFDQTDFERYKRATLSRADNTDERRAVREEVHLAKVSTLKRDL